MFFSQRRKTPAVEAVPEKTAPEPKTPGRRATGAFGEEVAAQHLSALGFREADRNWRPASGGGKLEFDIVGRWEGCLVFVEVKTGNALPGMDKGVPAALRNFTRAKQRNMARAARAYLTEKNLWNEPCRFDLVCVTLLPDAKPHVDIYRNVIELGQTLDSGDAAWQPW